jgi:hypothetical protein
MEWIRKVGRRGKDAARRASATLQDQLALPKDLDDIDEDEHSQPVGHDCADDCGPEQARGRRPATGESTGSAQFLVLGDVSAEDLDADAKERTGAGADDRA